MISWFIGHGGYMFYSFNENTNYILLCSFDICNYTWFNRAIHYSVITIKYYPQILPTNPDVTLHKIKLFLLVSWPKTCLVLSFKKYIYHFTAEKTLVRDWNEAQRKGNLRKILNSNTGNSQILEFKIILSWHLAFICAIYLLF